MRSCPAVRDRGSRGAVAALSAPRSSIVLAIVALAVVLPAAPASAASSIELEATYDVTATLDYGEGTIRVRSVAEVVNAAGRPVDRINFNTIAAARGGLVLLDATVDGGDADVTVTGQTLVVPLGRDLADGQRTRVVLDYRARFRGSTSGHDWLWSRANGIVSAYRWIPWVSRKISFERDNHGDPFVTPVSPRVDVSITSDRTLRFATSGRRTGGDGLTQTFAATNVRDFNFTASPSYRVLSGTSVDGETAIDVYTRSGDDDGMLAWARRAIDRYEDLVGPYPYPTFTIGQSSGGYAMESPGHIWLPYGLASSSIPFLVAHETAHQWFYATVGSDQASKPFADEALAELMARTLLGTLRGSRCSKATLDRTIHEYSSACYYEIVYIQGSNFLEKMRERMGTTRFWGALADYYADNRFELSGTERLLEALRAAATYDPLRSYRERFPRYY